MKSPSQEERILTHLEIYGSITQLESLDKYGCFRLASRISHLKTLGNIIDTEMIETPMGKRIAKYTLAKSQKEMF